MKITNHIYIILDDKNSKISIENIQKNEFPTKKERTSFFEKYVTAIKKHFDENEEYPIK